MSTVIMNLITLILALLAYTNRKYLLPSVSVIVVQ